jgi:hypothetical protein
VIRRFTICSIHQILQGDLVNEDELHTERNTRNAQEILVKKTEEKILIGRPKHRW